MPRSDADTLSGADPDAGRTSPAGSGDYVVQEGDCIASIAFDHGFFWETLWDDPSNAELRQRRGTPFVLLPGDRVTIPALREEQRPAATEQLHRFRLRGVPVIVKIRILESPPEPGSSDSRQASEEEGREGVELVVEEAAEESTEPQPAKNKPFQAIVDGTLAKDGETDGEGVIELALQPSARQVQIVIEPGTPRARLIDVRLGSLDPIQDRGGQAQRLANLGFSVDPSGQDAAGLSQTLAEFQKSQGLDATGRADTATLDILKQVHGS